MRLRRRNGKSETNEKRKGKTVDKPTNSIKKAVRRWDGHQNRAAAAAVSLAQPKV